MTRDTLDFLAWLVQAQTISLSAPDARDMARRAFTALDEIGAAIEAHDALASPDA